MWPLDHTLASPTSLLPGEHEWVTQTSCYGHVFALVMGLKWAMWLMETISIHLP